ncbi:MAG: hypothetical protein QME40_00340 [bacterium]|nr:hypothetical protein [bacterium]
MGFLANIWSRLKNIFSASPSGFLCDSCRYDYRTACTNPHRPNVKNCSNYKKR